MPIFKNRFILKGLAAVIGIPFGILVAFIIVISKGDIMGTDAKYALFLIGMLFVLTSLFTLAVYGGKYAPGFIVDGTGITNYTQAKQAKRNSMVNALLVILGLFRGSLTAAGTGLMAQKRQVAYIPWRAVRKVRYYPRQHTIIIKGRSTERIAVFCTKENYEEVEGYIKRKLVKPKKGE